MKKLMFRDKLPEGMTCYRIAKDLGIANQNVYSWENVPAKWVPKVAKMTGLSEHVLNPDVWEAP